VNNAMLRPGMDDGTHAAIGPGRVIAGVVAINIVVGALVAFAVWLSFSQYQDRAAINSRNLARTIEQYFTATIDRIDYGLSDIVAEVERQSRDGRIETGELNEFISIHASRQPAVHAIRFADARGDVYLGTGFPNAAPINVADRDYFIALRDNPAADLEISRPIVGRIDGKWTIILARRVGGPDGRFLGVVYSSLLLESIGDFLSKIEIGSSGGISLRDRDMGIIIRHPDPTGSFRGNKNVSPELRILLDRGDESGTYVSGTTWDGTARVVSFAKIGPHPLYVNVGIAPADYLDPWRSEVVLFAGVYALFSLATVVWAAASIRTWRGRAASEASTRRELERRVAEATTSLNEALREARAARDTAVSADRAKSEFLAGMSHELRTPLNAILGYVQLLRRDRGLTERQLTRLGTVERSGRHLLRLINDLLDLARIEARRLELRATEVDLDAFLSDIADVARMRADERDLLFALDRADDLPPAVRVDESRLRQILLNLLDNAVKFTDRGEVRLRARRLTKGGEAEGVRLRFEVLDTGVGMNAEQMNRLFRPFERVSESPERRTPGTGLGLAVSRHLAHLMDSEINVESVPDKGSRFWFDLTVPETEIRTTNRRSERHIVGYVGPRRRVLVVDDVEANRMLLADVLSDLGFEVDEAVDGRDAIERVEARRPDLVLMDVVMPVMDGVTAIRALRAGRDGDEMPIIAVSAGSTPEERTATMTAGADAFLVKPVERDTLLEMIGARLGLEWNLADRSERVVGERADCVAPSREALEVLRNLALAGDLRALRTTVGRIAADDERYRAFADTLDRLAREFRTREALSFVERWCPPEK